MAGYIRQSTFVDGDTITAALFNNEYNQLVNAFSNTSGHKHDGTTAEGPVIGLIGDAGETSPNNKVLIDTTNNYIEFYVEVSSNPVQQIYIADGAIVPVTDNDIDLGTSLLEFKNIYIDGTATIDTLTVDEAATVGTTLGVTGATTLSSTLGVTGSTTLSSTLAVTGATTLSSTLAVTGTSTLTGNVTATNDLSVGGNLTVTGNATISGNLTFGDADTDSINLSAEIDSNIVPNTDDTYDLGTSTKQWRNLYIDGTAEIDTLAIDGTTVTSTAAELNILDGVTSTAAELNILDGVTSTTAELNILDGVTATAAEINLLDGVTSTTAELNILDGVTATAAEINTLDGITSTVAELNILDGVTSNATELNLLDGITEIDTDISTVAATDTTLASAKAIKTYVDAQVTAQDLDFAGDTGGALSIDLDSESLTIAGGTGIDTSGALNTLTVAIDSTVATLTDTQTLTNKTLTTPVISSISNTGTLTLPTSTDTLVGRATTDTLTNKTLTSPDVNTPDIDGGTIDGTVIGGATPAAGTFTTLTANTSITGTLATAAQPNITSLGTLTALTGGTGDLNWDSGTLFVDSSANNVGIGTTSPASTLEISKSDQTNGATLSITNSFEGSGWTAGDTIGTINFRVDDGSTTEKIRGQIKVFDDTSVSTTYPAYSAMSFSTGLNNTLNERMRIDSSGNVGIGTTSPSGKIQANAADSQVAVMAGGDVSDPLYPAFGFDGQIGSNGGRGAGMYLPADGTLAWSTAGSERMRIDSSGNVGIGDTSPSSITSDVSALSLNGTNTGVSGGIIYKVNGSIKGYHYINSGNILHQAASGIGHRFLANDTDAMKIDTSGNVGIGTASPSNALDVQTSAGKFSVEALGGGSVRLASNGSMGMNVAAGYSYEIDVGGSEVMRIDSSGNLLVSKTAANTSTVGIEARENGLLVATRDGGQPLLIDRLTNDGDLVLFRKDSTTVGSIGTTGGKLYIGTPDGSDAYLRFESNEISPCTSAGAFRDGAIDLGKSASRWKDLYLSGGAYLGGTGSANHLDDYEEGTWTPELRNNGTALTQSWAYRSGVYTKVGRVVHVHFGGKLNSLSGTGSGALRIYGLPFTSATTGGFQEPAENLFLGNQPTAEDSYTVYAFIGNNNSYLECRELTGVDDVFESNKIDGNTFFKFQMTYYV